jgi:hypothetical protein
MNGAIRPEKTEFISHQPSNFILVENGESGVVIRAACDNFSEQRKSLFIKQIAAEGFIPDIYQWFSNPDSGGFPSLEWIIDSSWVKVHAAVRRKADRAMGRMFLAATVLWLTLMGALFATAARG